jgi:GrpB-like predicted nucleotidyltransferase (UPF0157 family)
MAAGRLVIYCLVPQELSKELLKPLRKHYRKDPRIEVIADRRKGPRRKPLSVAEPPRPPSGEDDKRDRGDRRRPVLPRSVAALPEIPDADRVVFVQRLLPVSDAMQKVPTEEIVARVKAADPEAPTELFWRLYERVHSRHTALLGVPSDADREVVTAFGRLLDALESDDERPFEQLLYDVVNETGADVNARRAGVPDVDHHFDEGDTLEIHDAALDEPIAVQERDPRWFHRAMGERDRIVRNMRDDLEDIQHVGSTSVPAIASRPIVDLIAAPQPGRLETVRAKLVGLGYTDCGDAGTPGRVYMRRRGLMRVDVHLIDHDSRLWKEAVALREFLRRNPIEAHRWPTAKREAARLSSHSYLQYIELRSKALTELCERAFGKTRNERAEESASA